MSQQSAFEILSPTMADLTHFDASGASRMVDVGDKPVSRRLARASAAVRMAPQTLALILQRNSKKGDVLEVARLAGIMAAKRTADLIPLCHPLAIDAVSVDFTSPDDQTLVIGGTVAVEAKTGVEMEALTVVSVAALTVYDMCKSVDRGITIEHIQLEEKSGGRSGHWRRAAEP
jgi:cyclic pyranopterin phosphate synthase